MFELGLGFRFQYFCLINSDLGFRIWVRLGLGERGKLRGALVIQARIRTRV